MMPSAAKEATPALRVRNADLDKVWKWRANHEQWCLDNEAHIRRLGEINARRERKNKGKRKIAASALQSPKLRARRRAERNRIRENEAIVRDILRKRGK